MTGKQFFQFLVIWLFFLAKANGQTFQYFTLDSLLLGNSEQMGIANNGKSDGMRLTILGPYKANYVEKLDSGAFRTKVKENKEMSFGSDNGYEEFKIKKYESHAYYRMGLNRESDSATSFFSFFTSYRMKSETILSTILSKKDAASTSESFDDKKELSGYITIKDDSVLWRFGIFSPEYSGNGLNTGLTGFLTNGIDSLTIDFAYADVMKRSKKAPFEEKIVYRSTRGYTLVNQENRQMAALIFKQSMAYLGAKKLDNFTGGELAIIGKENGKEARLAIASFFAILYGIK